MNILELLATIFKDADGNVLPEFDGHMENVGSLQTMVTELVESNTTKDAQIETLGAEIVGLKEDNSKLRLRILDLGVPLNGNDTETNHDDELIELADEFSDEAMED